MGRTNLVRWVGGAAGAAAIASGSYALGAEAAGIILPAGELAWAPEEPGSPQQMVTLWGDRARGEATVLIKTPGGWESGTHAHSADYHAVLVAGTWMHAAEGSVGEELLPGSYWMQPAKEMHHDHCKVGSECIVLVHTDEKIDLIRGETK